MKIWVHSFQPMRLHHDFLMHCMLYVSHAHVYMCVCILYMCICLLFIKWIPIS